MNKARKIEGPQDIKPGDEVIATDAFGKEHRMLATSAVRSVGHSFPLVYVTLPDRNDPIPWPVEDLRRPS